MAMEEWRKGRHTDKKAGIGWGVPTVMEGTSVYHAELEKQGWGRGWPALAGDLCEQASTHCLSSNSVFCVPERRDLHLPVSAFSGQLNACSWNRGMLCLGDWSLIIHV